MFLQVCVCPQGGSTWAGTPPGPGAPPGPGTPPGQVLPGTRYTPSGTMYSPPPQDQVHPPPRDQVHPSRAVHAGRYGQQAGGMHPTGMHSC